MQFDTDHPGISDRLRVGVLTLSNRRPVKSTACSGTGVDGALTRRSKTDGKIREREPIRPDDGRQRHHGAAQKEMAARESRHSKKIKW
jgi:hypothetical protein